jgi:hypothetical protein
LYNLQDFEGALEAYRQVLWLLAPGECRQLRLLIKKQIVTLERIVKNKERAT